MQPRWPSCRYLFDLALDFQLKLPSRPLHRVNYDCGMEPYRMCSCDPIENILIYLQPKNLNGRLSRRCHLCLHCLRYRPLRKSDWHARDETSWLRDLGWEGLERHHPDFPFDSIESSGRLLQQKQLAESVLSIQGDCGKSDVYGD